MRLPSLLLAPLTSILAQETNVTTGELGDAVSNLNNPEGAAYRAVLVENPYNVTGMITAVSADERGTEFAVDFGNLPSEGGPFSYHLHVMPVASDGDCNSTLAHLDPFIRGETVPCDSSRPETCQVGDLGGKHGKADNTSFAASFTDQFVSLREGDGAFFGNRSFVIHFANKSRIACGNFATLNASDIIDEPLLLTSSSTSTLTSTSTATSTSTLTAELGTAALESAVIFSTTTITVDGVVTVLPAPLSASSTEVAFATLSIPANSTSVLFSNSTATLAASRISVPSMPTSTFSPALVSANDAAMLEGYSIWLFLACYAALWTLA